MGRFTQQDSWAYADPGVPASLNLYAYCINDPIQFIDISGHYYIIQSGSLYTATPVSKSMTFLKKAALWCGGWAIHSMYNKEVKNGVVGGTSKISELPTVYPLEIEIMKKRVDGELPPGWNLLTGVRDTGANFTAMDALDDINNMDYKIFTLMSAANVSTTMINLDALKERMERTQSFIYDRWQYFTNETYIGESLFGIYAKIHAASPEQRQSVIADYLSKSSTATYFNIADRFLYEKHLAMQQVFNNNVKNWEQYYTLIQDYRSYIYGGT